MWYAGGIIKYITIPEAARIADYRDDNALRIAARKGRLRTEQLGPRTRVTTRAWLDEYLGDVKPRGISRGEPRTANRDEGTNTIASLGWSRAEAGAIRDQLRSFAEDWDAPGMDAYDAL
jgi:hypothetical protein